MKLKIGDKGHFLDSAIEDYPDKERKEQLNEVYTIDNINGDIYTISNGFSEMEVLAHEFKYECSGQKNN